jgi:hypothetical protein
MKRLYIVLILALTELLVLAFASLPHQPTPGLIVLNRVEYPLYPNARIISKTNCVARLTSEDDRTAVVSFYNNAFHLPGQDRLGILSPLLQDIIKVERVSNDTLITMAVKPCENLVP